MVLGKFMPPTTGHDVLIEHAVKRHAALTIFVGQRSGEEVIPLALRVGWMEQRWGARARIVGLAGPPPRGPAAIWRYRRAFLGCYFGGRSPAAFYASDLHALPLALVLGTRLRLVDPKRSLVPISASQVRCDPARHWHHIALQARPYFVMHIIASATGGSAAVPVSTRWARIGQVGEAPGDAGDPTCRWPSGDLVPSTRRACSTRSQRAAASARLPW